MNNEEKAVRQEIVALGKSLFNRGLTGGSSGNISVKIEGGWLMTPTNSCLGDLDPNRISKLDMKENHIEGDPPTKECFLHTAIYRNRPECGAIVHLHSTYSTALSCLTEIDPENALPAITPYCVMKIGKLPLIPYFPPGDPRLVEEVNKKASRHKALLLANHGPVVSGKNLKEAIYALEELEESAKIFFLTKQLPTRYLQDEEIEELLKR